MNRYEARAFIDETHELLRKAAAGTLSDSEEEAVLELEANAVKILNSRNLSDLKIIRDDGAGASDNPLEVAYNSFNDVESIEIQDLTRVVEMGDGFKRLDYKRYTAHGKKYEVDSGERTSAGHPVMRTTSDYVQSGAEGFIEKGGKHMPFGAASALVARLLEAKAAGVV